MRRMFYIKKYQNGFLRKLLWKKNVRDCGRVSDLQQNKENPMLEIY